MPTIRAYCYIRFSRPEQPRSDSLRRQTELVKDYAAKNGFFLDTSLNLQDFSKGDK